MLLVSPERLNNPDFRDRVLPRLTATAGHAGGRRGALHLRLGARLPARLPAAARPDRRAAGRASRCWPPRRPRTTGWSSTSPSSWAWARPRPAADGAAGAARLAGPGEPAAVGGVAAHPGPAAGLAGRAARRAARGRHRLHADHRRRRGGGRVPARARVPGGLLHRADRAGRAAGRRGRPAGQPGEGAGGHERARHGLRQARPRVRRAPRRAGLAGGLLPADRPGRARASSGPRWCCCPATRTGTSGRTSPRWRSRPSRWCARRCGCSTAPGSSRCPRRRSRRGWTCRAPGWRCCSRCSTRTAPCGGSSGGWVGTGADWVYDEQRHRRIAEARRAEQQAMLDYLGTTGCRLAFLRRQLDDPDSGPDARCGRCDNCTGTVWNTAVDPGSGRPPTSGWPGRGSRWRRASSGRAAWPSSACRCPGGSRPASWPSRAG